MKSKAIIPAAFGVLAIATLCPATLSAALIHQWALDETTLPDNISGAPGTVVDSTGNSTAGRLFGYAPGADLTGVIGVAGPPGLGTAYNFTEATGISGVFTNSKTAIPATLDFSLFVSVSVSAPQVGQGALFSNNNNTNPNRSTLGLAGSQIFFFVNGGAFDTTGDSLSNGDAFFFTADGTGVGGVNLFDGGFHQVGVSRQSSRFDLSIDGLVVASGTTTTTGNIDQSVEWMIGRTRAFGSDLDAVVADVKVFDTYAVPEPSSFALLGLGGLLLARRRRR